jgi:hypothetical protein
VHGRIRIEGLLSAGPSALGAGSEMKTARSPRARANSFKGRAEARAVRFPPGAALRDFGCRAGDATTTPDRSIVVPARVARNHRSVWNLSVFRGMMYL